MHLQANQGGPGLIHIIGSPLLIPSPGIMTQNSSLFLLVGLGLGLAIAARHTDLFNFYIYYVCAVPNQICSKVRQYI